MRSHTVQSTFAGGLVSPQMQGQVQSEAYYKSLSIATNVDITPTGGVRRRAGLSAFIATMTENIAKTEQFIIDNEVNYFVTFSVAEPTLSTPDFIRIKIYNNSGTAIQQLDFSGFTPARLLEHYDNFRTAQIVQSGNYMFIFYSPQAIDAIPSVLIRDPDTDTFTFVTLGNVLTNKPYLNPTTFDIYVSATHATDNGETISVPQVDTDTVFELFDYIGFLPYTATLFGGRFFFGGFEKAPNLIVSSVANNLLDMSLGSYSSPTLTTLESDGIADFLEVDEYSPIVALYGNRNLQAFTATAELINTAQTITPSTSSWARQTSIGAKYASPKSINGTTVFISKNGSSVRSSVYDDKQAAYITSNVTSLLGEEAKGIIDIQPAPSSNGSDTDKFLVLKDNGEVLVLHTSRENGVSGWTKYVTNGTVLDITASYGIIYFTVERHVLNLSTLVEEKTYLVEKLDKDRLLDSSLKNEAEQTLQYNVVFGTDNVVFGTDNIIHGGETFVGNIQLVTPQDSVWDIMFESSFNTFVGVANGFIYEPLYLGFPNFDLSVPANSRSAEVGLDFEVEVETLPININTNQGMGVNLRKRVVRIILNLYNSLGIIVKDKAVPDKELPLLFGGDNEPYTGIKELYFLGHDRLTSINVKQDYPAPFELLSIDSEVEN